MSNKIVRYQHWMDAIVDLVAAGDNGDQKLDKTVRQALEKLEEPERELAERRYLMGQSIALISEELKRSERDVERNLREVTLKLQCLLEPFVAERFGLRTTNQRKCPICKSANRECAEKIIAGKQQKETWRRVMQELRHLGLTVNSPQTLIGHVKYHLEYHPDSSIPKNNDN